MSIAQRSPVGSGVAGAGSWPGNGTVYVQSTCQRSGSSQVGLICVSFIVEDTPAPRALNHAGMRPPLPALACCASTSVELGVAAVAIYVWVTELPFKMSKFPFRGFLGGRTTDFQ